MKKSRSALFGRRKPDIYRCREVKNYAKGNNYSRRQSKRRYGKNYHK